MTPNGSAPQTTWLARKRTSNFWLIIVAALFIIVPFLTWYLTWFGRTLSDEKIAEYLADEKHPRNIQHALAQIEARMENGDQSVRKFYPRIIELAGSPTGEVRKTVAWVMGQDNGSAEFHRALLELVKDNEPLVRRNAALELVRFGDPSGRAELRAMLALFEVKAPFGGTLVSLLAVGSSVHDGSLLARIRDASGSVQEFRSPVDGTITTPIVAREGEAIIANQTIAWLRPDRESIIAALRALSFVGTTDDLPSIESCAQVDASREIADLAKQTANNIRSRTTH